MATVRARSIGSSLLMWCAAALVALGAVACGHEIGDSCGTSYDCSQQGSRSCDRTQAGGYCTITPCEKSSCPDESTCVEFRPGEDRLAITYCMRKCDSNSDCRDDEGYRCTTAQQFGGCNGMEAKTLDSDTQRFCSNAPAMPAGSVAAPMCMSAGGS